MSGEPELYEQLFLAVERQAEEARLAAEASGDVRWRVGPQKRCACCNAVLAGQAKFEVIATDDRLTEFIASNDPAARLRTAIFHRYFLRRHRPVLENDTASCFTCAGPVWPCPDLRAFAGALEVPIP